IAPRHVPVSRSGRESFLADLLCVPCRRYLALHIRRLVTARPWRAAFTTKLFPGQQTVSTLPTRELLCGDSARAAGVEGGGLATLHHTCQIRFELFNRRHHRRTLR